jgi:serine/threonine protein phosphatase PrpC
LKCRQQQPPHHPSSCTAQEDAHAMSLDVGNDGKTGFFAVFDGHGGKEVAKFVALKMVRVVTWSADKHQQLASISMQQCAVVR